MEKRRVVVTGIGAVTPLGLDASSSWEGAISGKSGVGMLTRLDAEAFPMKVAAEINDFELLTILIEKKQGKWIDLHNLL